MYTRSRSRSRSRSRDLFLSKHNDPSGARTPVYLAVICVSTFIALSTPALSLLVMGESQKGMRCGITSGTRMKPGADGAWLLLYGWGYVNP
jgi:hypothetical protein